MYSSNIGVLLCTTSPRATIGPHGVVLCSEISLFYIYRTIAEYHRLWQNTSMRTVYHPAADDLSLASVLYALSDPVRLEIVRSITAHGERQGGTLGIPLAKATLSHHLKVLPR